MSSSSTRPRVADTLDIWTVYGRPSDYPDKYVARRFEIGAGIITPTGDMFMADTLAELRALLPPGLILIERDKNDDPVIVEAWL